MIGEADPHARHKVNVVNLETARRAGAEESAVRSKMGIKNMTLAYFEKNPGATDLGFELVLFLSALAGSRVCAHRSRRLVAGGDPIAENALSNAGSLVPASTKGTRNIGRSRRC